MLLRAPDTDGGYTPPFSTLYVTLLLESTSNSPYSLGTPPAISDSGSALASASHGTSPASAVHCSAAKCKSNSDRLYDDEYWVPRIVYSESSLSIGRCGDPWSPKAMRVQIRLVLESNIGIPAECTRHSPPAPSAL